MIVSCPKNLGEGSVETTRRVTSVKARITEVTNAGAKTPQRLAKMSLSCINEREVHQGISDHDRCAVIDLVIVVDK